MSICTRMLCKRKAYKEDIKFKRSRADFEETVCEFYGCCNRNSLDGIDFSNSTCRVCEEIRKRIAISDRIYYIPSDDCEEVCI